MIDFSKSYIGYIDPGAGSLIVQMVMASCIGTVVMLRRAIFGNFWRKTTKDCKKAVVTKSQRKQHDDKPE
jgi:hypothetical protein